MMMYTSNYDFINNILYLTFLFIKKILEVFDNSAYTEMLQRLQKPDMVKSMIGLSEVKDKVKKIVAVAKYVQKENEQGIVANKSVPINLNMCFLGNPGTGKTTVARSLASILHKIGIVKTDKFIEASRSDLVAPYMGQTASKTKQICEDAMGGVLFIDEAYSLVQDISDSFGKEALATLIKEMEDHRDNLIVILAGYRDEMEKLLESNSGLKSRISEYIEFNDYNDEELLQIFRTFMDENSIIASESAMKRKKEMVGELYNQKGGTKGFGNAREIRTLYERIWQNMVMRVESSDSSVNRKQFIEEDIL